MMETRIADLNSCPANPKAPPPLRFVISGATKSGAHSMAGWLLGASGLTSLSGGGIRSEQSMMAVQAGSHRFATDKRAFNFAEIGENEDVMRHLAEEAPYAELSVILTGADDGILPQTRRQAIVASLLGVRHAVLAVNQNDLGGLSASAFAAMEAEFRDFAATLKFQTVSVVPVSVRDGGNVTAVSPQTPWYTGKTLLATLEETDTGAALSELPFRMPVQSVDRSRPAALAVSGVIASGRVASDGRIVLAPSGRPARILRIAGEYGDRHRAEAQEAVTLILAEDVDASPGGMLVAADARPEVADQLAASILWFGDEELLPHRQYIIKLGTQTVAGEITSLRYRLDPNSLEHIAARTLRRDEIGLAHISTAEPLIFDPYRDNRGTGRFALIDRTTNATIGAGVIEFGLRRASNVHWQAIDVNVDARSGLKGQKPCVLWFTGLSGSGKSTIANLVEKRLFAEGRHTYILDGDNVRHGLNKDLGFTDADRVENIRRVAETAKLFVDAGLIVLVSFISPFRSERDMARGLLKPGQFVEIHVDTPLSICQSRDPKGLYKRAAQGLIKNFTGLDSPYEAPENPELTLSTEHAGADILASNVVAHLKALTMIP